MSSLFIFIGAVGGGVITESVVGFSPFCKLAQLGAEVQFQGFPYNPLGVTIGCVDLFGCGVGGLRPYPFPTASSMSSIQLLPFPLLLAWVSVNPMISLEWAVCFTLDLPFPQ